MEDFANKVENKRAQRHTYIDMVGACSICWPFMETCISKGVQLWKNAGIL